jgi:hypothetical protein
LLIAYVRRLTRFISSDRFSDSMATYLLGLWTPDLSKLEYMPVGVIVRDGDELAMRLIGESLLPEEYRPKSEISRSVWKNMVNIFREQKEYSSGPANLYFTKPSLEFEGSLEEKADQLFEQAVVPGLK